MIKLQINRVKTRKEQPRTRNSNYLKKKSGRFLLSDIFERNEKGFVIENVVNGNKRAFLSKSFL